MAMLVAQASVLHFLENLLPNPIPVPGVKLGLANIITLLVLVLWDFKTALQVSVLRTILGSMLSGTLFGVGFFLGAAGAVTATVGMAVLLRWLPGASLIIIAIGGAAAHVLGQLAAAAWLLEFAGIFYYLPVMLLFSVPTGALTGLLTKEVVAYIQANNRLLAFFQSEDTKG